MTTPPLPLRIGYTGTRHGMSVAQLRTISDKLADIHVPIVAHHGCCVGGDHQFHDICIVRGARIIGHPGPDWPHGKLCARVVCDEVREPRPYLTRNQDIVNAVSRDHEDDRTAGIMIAAPLQDSPADGGTWATIKMALRALRRGVLRELCVVGRSGQMLRHEEWTW